MAMARASLLSVVFCLAGICSVSAQSYNPVGPQTNVPISTVEDGGWVLCHSNSYDSATGDELATIQTGLCGSGTRIMLACGPTNGDTLTLLSQATSAEVFTDPGSGFNDTHLANGAQWYFSLGGGGGSGEFSWGFAGAGADVERDNCDTETDDAELRLCWHLDPGSGGFRCGSELDPGNDWTKYVYTTAPGVPTVPPWLLPLVAVMLVMGAAALLRRRVSAGSTT